MSTVYGGTPPGITGTHYGGSGLGVLGSLIPSDGSSGPGYLYPGLDLPNDNNKELRAVITRSPSGTLIVYEDSSFTYSGNSDYVLYQLYVDGVLSSIDIGYGSGIGRFDLLIGSLTPSELSGNADTSTFTITGIIVGYSATYVPGTYIFNSSKRNFTFNADKRASSFNSAPRYYTYTGN